MERYSPDNWQENRGHNLRQFRKELVEKYKGGVIYDDGDIDALKYAAQLYEDNSHDGDSWKVISQALNNLSESI